MSRCVICGKETRKTLFKKALFHTHICSMECLIKYFKPLHEHGIPIQQTLDKTIEERGYWIL